MRLEPGVLAAAASIPLDHEPLPAEQIVAGKPTTGSLVLDDSDGVELGVWEMTAGTATDTEIDEVFIVIAGAATVEFESGQDAVELMPGSIVRLAAGMRTTWTVHETLRKVYIASV